MEYSKAHYKKMNVHEYLAQLKSLSQEIVEKKPAAGELLDNFTHCLQAATGVIKDKKDKKSPVGQIALNKELSITQKAEKIYSLS